LLYKYCPLERRDILENGLIRFTQPGDFNDPFELHPSFDLMSKADLAALPEAPGQEGIDGPKMHRLTPEAMQTMFGAILPGLQNQLAQHAGQQGAYSLDNNRMAQATFDSKFGILCLAEAPDSLLMWAHYANNHNGFVIQFDETHEFFAPTLHGEQALELTKVEYSVQRPVLSYSTINTPSLYYRKSPEWSCENEWRLVKLLDTAKRVLPHPEFPRCLFELPPSAVKGVIIGLSVTHEDRLKLFDLLAQPHLQHATVYQTALSKNDYMLEIHPPLDGKFPPGAISGVVCEAR
jgi:Protein of unknown function (DUF2971)